MRLTVDLNSDLGEAFGAYTIGRDSEIIPLVSSVNIATGFHAGDPNVMEKTVELAVKSKVAIGAHPGFPDLQGFGRRSMELQPGEIRTLILYQIGALDAFCRTAGSKVSYVKPHGALYNQAEKDLGVALEIVKAIFDYDPQMYILSAYGSQMSVAAKQIGLQTANEFFADRGYEPDGSLVERSKPNAIIHDSKIALKRVIRALNEGVVEAVNGQDIPMQVDSICVHGDSESALNFVREIRQGLSENDFTIKSFSTIK